MNRTVAVKGNGSCDNQKQKYEKRAFMAISAYDFRDFYKRRAGRLIARLLTGHIRGMLSPVNGKTLVGYGYAAPYMSRLYKETERAICINPGKIGGSHWPENKKNALCLTDDGLLPLETETVDCLFVVHGLEFTDFPDELLKEFWRVLKGHGRLVLVVPNRLGLWARADWTPFGHGAPYSFNQITQHLKDNLFAIEKADRALLMPPFRSFIVLKAAYFYESFGRFLFPGLAGVHLIEATKQIYAGLPEGKRERLAGKRRYAIQNAIQNIVNGRGN